MSKFDYKGHVKVRSQVVVESDIFVILWHFRNANTFFKPQELWTSCLHIVLTVECSFSRTIASVGRRKRLDCICRPCLHRWELKPLKQTYVGATGGPHLDFLSLSYFFNRFIIAEHSRLRGFIWSRGLRHPGHSTAGGSRPRCIVRNGSRRRR